MNLRNEIEIELILTKASSMQGNPIKLTEDRLAEILRKAI